MNGRPCLQGYNVHVHGGEWFHAAFRIRIRPDPKLFDLNDPDPAPDPSLFHTKLKNIFLKTTKKWTNSSYTHTFLVCLSTLLVVCPSSSTASCISPPLVVCPSPPLAVYPFPFSRCLSLSSPCCLSLSSHRCLSLSSLFIPLLSSLSIPLLLSPSFPLFSSLFIPLLSYILRCQGKECCTLGYEHFDFFWEDGKGKSGNGCLLWFYDVFLKRFDVLLCRFFTCLVTLKFAKNKIMSQKALSF